MNATPTASFKRLLQVILGGTQDHLLGFEELDALTGMDVWARVLDVSQLEGANLQGGAWIISTMLFHAFCVNNPCMEARASTGIRAGRQPCRAGNGVHPKKPSLTGLRQR